MNILIFGGGRVGTRRATKFAEAGARVTVVAEKVSEVLKNNSKINVIEKKLSSTKELEELIKKADLIIIATSSKELNDKIFSVAKRLGKLVNDATNADRSDVHVPFEDEVDGIRLAVSSEGASGVSAHLALFIAKECLERNNLWKNINKFAKLFKKELKENISDPKRRFQLYWFVMLDDEVMRLIKEGRIEEALKKALELALTTENIKGYEPEMAMPRFLNKWGTELLGSCYVPYEGQNTTK